MNFADWYTDTVDVWRVQPTTTNSLTTNQRVEVLTAVPCWIFQTDNRAIKMQQTAAEVHQEDYLACDVSVDIRAGDELHIHRGALIGRTVVEMRAFAADPNPYFEPFGAVVPGLEHQEIRLLQQERVK